MVQWGQYCGIWGGWKNNVLFTDPGGKFGSSKICVYIELDIMKEKWVKD